MIIAVLAACLVSGGFQFDTRNFTVAVLLLNIWYLQLSYFYSCFWVLIKKLVAPIPCAHSRFTIAWIENHLELAHNDYFELSCIHENQFQSIVSSIDFQLLQVVVHLEIHITEDLMADHSISWGYAPTVWLRQRIGRSARRIILQEEPQSTSKFICSQKWVKLR